MDIVIPLADHDSTGNVELRYALRSLDKFLRGIDRLFIMGPDPGFLKNTNIIHIMDLHDYANKEKNIFTKTFAACISNAEVSENFIYSNNDFFLLSSFEAASFPYFFKGDLQHHIGYRSANDPYKFAMENTQKVLRGAGHPCLYFDVHSPIVYNRARFVDTMLRYDWNVPFGYVTKTLYCNTAGIAGVAAEDIKFKKPVSGSSIYRRISGYPMFSTDENAMNQDMLEVLQDIYPDKSRWEI